MSPSEHPNATKQDRQRRSRPSVAEIMFWTVLALIFLPMIFGWAPLRLLGCDHPPRSAGKAMAIGVMKQLGEAAISYATTHDGHLPAPDIEGKDSWDNAALPASGDVWYNALPHLLGKKSAGDFATEKRVAAFYTQENVFYLPGAQYPENKRLEKPHFALAMNALLFPRGADGKVGAVKLSEIQMPARTVLFYEHGLPGETRAHDAQSKADYDGAPKGNPKSFVARYNKRGLIVFADGHVEEVSGKQLLTDDGKIVWSPNSVNDPQAIFWMADPRRDPNAPRK